MNMAAQKLTTSGWQAELELGLAPRPGRSALVHRKQRGPLAVQRPFYPEGDVCHLYLLHPPGGVVGGDSLHIQTSVAGGAHALVTTPGATKFYLSAGDTAQQLQALHVEKEASLEWLPQENIFFPGALTRLHTRIKLARGARFIGWETQCLGRPVIAERFDRGCADFRLDIEQDGRPLLLERLTVSAQRLDGAAGLRGWPVNATLVATPATNTELALVRELIADAPNTGATLLDDLLVVRHLGDSTEQCRKLFIAVWAAIRPAVIGRAPCPPRIWST
jgi:urease accessory protein